MNILTYLSNSMIPFVIFIIIGFGILQKIPVFDSFVKGAEDGFLTIYKILPTLIGLMVGVGLFRQSGALTGLATLIQPLTNLLHFPGELVPLVVVKMFSSSAATGLLLDVYKQFGTDSYLGLLASILMSCSETIFYTMSMYFVTAGVMRTRYTLAGALIATLGGVIASVWLVNTML